MRSFSLYFNPCFKDEKNQVFSAIIWLDQTWTDYHFRWDANDFGNITTINLPPNRVWKPDLLLYNSVTSSVYPHDTRLLTCTSVYLPSTTDSASEKFDQVFPSNVVVKNTGELNWIPPGMFHSFCTIHVIWFPFDSQSCSLKFGTWSYQGNAVDLKLKCDDIDQDNECDFSNVVDLSAYTAHSEWALESATVKRNQDNYGTADQTYIDITIHVHMQRRALYYVFNIIVPCMIMSVMSLLVFTLPPDANEKIVLVLYFTCTIVLCSMSLVFAIVLLNCHHHTGGIIHVPWLIGTFTNIWLASILRIDRRVENSGSYTNEKLEHGIVSKTLSPTSPQVSDRKPTETFNHQPSTCDPHATLSWTNKVDLGEEFRPTLLYSGEQTDEELVGVDEAQNYNHIELQAVIKQNRYFDTSPKSVQQRESSKVRYACVMEPERNPASRTRIKLAKSFKPPSSSDSSTLSLQKPTKQQYSNDVRSTPHALNPSEFHVGSPAVSPKQDALPFQLNSSALNRAKEFHEKALILRRLRELKQELRYVTGRMHRQNTEARNSSEWKLACRVLDRLCLVIFAALNLFTTLGILTSAPTIIKAFTSKGEPSKPL
ncbi:hypothetical protein EG68_00215 [Paragonimus skrjabini miyazakii]|uniref:Uncharacterized protein n=1 Tax=Paragonimus skrjabini miyazakii TaxID=59628 RepID=A0A8S9Z7F6_9TREM|nr:hypothetical protein EG68_00215 [Paragonimus skrjabini miyazakii]